VITGQARHVGFVAEIVAVEMGAKDGQILGFAPLTAGLSLGDVQAGRCARYRAGEDAGRERTRTIEHYLGALLTLLLIVLAPAMCEFLISL
jgi:hypothetical protein